MNLLRTFGKGGIFVAFISIILFHYKYKNMVFLPKPSGPYAVAATDVITKSGKDGTFFRLFYPTKQFTPNEQLCPKWMPLPGYARGIAGFIQLPSFGWIVNYVLRNFYIPVLMNGPLEMPESIEKLPLFVFSHGLGGTRNIQSFTCYDLASHGFFVAAIEHKDKSASATYWLEEKECENGSKQYEEQWIEYAPKPPDAELEFKLRNEEINVRTKEVSKLLDNLIELNNGNLEPLKHGVDLSMFKHKIDMDKFGIYGHSFGGGTAIKTLQCDNRFKAGVILDAWMYPIEKEFYRKAINQPMLFINNEAFMWKENVAAIRKLDGDTLGLELTRKMITLMGAVHWSHTDLTFILPQFWLVNRIFPASGKTDPLKVNEISGVATRWFFGKHLGICKISGEVDEIYDKYPDLVIKGSNIELDEELVQKSKEKIRSNL